MKLKKINDISIIHNNGEILVTDEIPVTHEFADQLYIRSMTMSKGQLVKGAIHNDNHIWFLMTGKVAIKNNDEIVIHEAPCYTISKAGSQRYIYAHENSIFINVHKNPTNTQDIKKLEQELVSLTQEQYEQKNK